MGKRWGNQGNFGGTRVLRRFGPCTIDTPRRELRRDGAAVHLTPKAFDLLVFLIDAAPRVVPKPELHQRLWPGTFVTDATLAGLIKEIRRALGDHDPGARIIRTVHRVGYAFGVQVEGAASAARACHHWLVFDGRQVALREGENLIGRDASAHVTIDLYSISRAHARIVVRDDGAWIEDRRSKNGTRVGDQPVTAATVLRDGDRLRFGTVFAVYRTAGASISPGTHGGTGTHTVDVDVFPQEDPST